jgi:hypothetical protein
MTQYVVAKDVIVKLITSSNQSTPTAGRITFAGIASSGTKSDSITSRVGEERTARAVMNGRQDKLGRLSPAALTDMFSLFPFPALTFQ